MEPYKIKLTTSSYQLQGSNSVDISGIEVIYCVPSMYLRYIRYSNSCIVVPSARVTICSERQNQQKPLLTLMGFELVTISLIINAPPTELPNQDAR